MNWRKPGFFAVGALVVVLLIGGAYYLGLSRSQPTPQQESSSLPRSSPVASGQWITLPTSVPGQPTPTPPPGAFVFRNPIGQPVVYVPSSATPSSASWQTYTSQSDGYSIDYPSDWIKTERDDKGHTTPAVYPPGTNTRENLPGGPKGITVGWIDSYQSPKPNDPTIADIRSVTINGVTGQMYTVSALGKGIIAAFPRKGGYLLLTAALTGVESDVIKQDAIIINVFQQMLVSLKFL